tara:strand:+ start:103 stop:576 length:474 start_codon:yes stop_codon:yes gene_type:complete
MYRAHKEKFTWNKRTTKRSLYAHNPQTDVILPNDPPGPGKGKTGHDIVTKYGLQPEGDKGGAKGASFIMKALKYSRMIPGFLKKGLSLPSMMLGSHKAYGATIYDEEGFSKITGLNYAGQSREDIASQSMSQEEAAKITEGLTSHMYQSKLAEIQNR